MKRLYYILCFLAFSNLASATNYYWVGGTGAWSDYANHWATSSGGTVFHVTIPSPSDDVLFDVNSFASTGDTVFMDTTITNCRNMDWSGVIHTPTISGSMNLRIYGSFSLAVGMNWPNNGSLQFLSVMPGNTIASAGHNLGGLLFGGVGGEWRLNDDLQCGNMGLVHGTFRSGNYNIHASSIDANNADSVSLLLGTSVVTASTVNLRAQLGTLIVDVDSSDFVITSSIFQTGPDTYRDVIFSSPFTQASLSVYNSVFRNVTFYFRGTIGGGGGTFQKVIFPDQASIQGDQTFDTLLFNNPGKTITLGYSSTITIQDALIADGTCSQPITMQSAAAGSPATISKGSGAVTCSYLVMKDILATGGAAFTANNSVDLGNNTGWIINSTPARNMYWVGGKGNWSDPNHWSLSSGGAVGNCLPAFSDNVFFDSNSFPTANDTVTMNVSPAYCRNLDFTGVLNTPVIRQGTFYIYGSLTLAASMNWASNGSLQFLSVMPGNTITSAGHNLGGLLFGGVGGEWTLNDDLQCGNMGLVHGTFRSGNYNIHASSIDANNADSVSLLLGTSVVTASTVNLRAQLGTLIVDVDSSDFVITSSIFQAGPDTYRDVIFSSPFTQASLSVYNSVFRNVTFYFRGTIGGGGGTFQKVIFPDQASIQGDQTFDTLLFNNPGKTITLGYSSTITIQDALIADGTCSQPITMQSAAAGSPATISKGSGAVTCSYLVMKDILATGGAAFTANNSVDLGNNTGWIINSTPARNMYWVGGKGNWSDPNHWSLSSGGAVGNCLPAFSDNVFFDSNSFPTANDTVTMNVSPAYCRNLDFTGVLNTPVIRQGTFYIYGSLTLAASMNWASNGSLQFLSVMPGNTITSAGHNLGGLLFGGVGGEWRLNDDLQCGNMGLVHGTFRSGNYNIHASSIDANNADSVSLLLGTSVVTASTVNLRAQLGTLIVDVDSSDFVITSSIFQAGPDTYRDVIFSSPFTQASLSVYNSVFRNVTFYFRGTIGGGGGTFQKVIFPDQASIQGDQTFDTLLFNNPGKTITLGYSSTITIQDYLQIQSDPGFPTSISCASGTATISKPAGTVCADFIYLQNIHATGGAAFYAGDHSVDLGGNTGWNWTRCAPLISNVWPGDCNYDLVTDNLDLLNIGVAMGDTGFVRPSASLSYIAQPCQDWYWQFLNAVNVKHADCDGNGTVEAADTTAISLNYGLTHPARPAGSNQSTATGTDLILQLPATAVAPGSVISAPILLGTNGNPANAIYGIAFTIDYDSAYIQPGTMSIDYTGSWVAGAGNYLHIEKDFPADGKLDIAFTRYNHTDVSGYGLIATLNFTVSNTATGLLGMSFSKVKIISHNEIEVPVVPQSTSLTVNVNEIKNSTPVALYPNPTRDELFIATGPLKGGKAKIFVTNLLGQEMIHMEKTTDHSNRLSAQLKLNQLSEGIYFLRIETEKESLVQKFVKE